MNKEYVIYSIFMLLETILVYGISSDRSNMKVTYLFKEFPYKEIAKNEAMFREYETACELGCAENKGLSKVLCTRQCVSPSCYKDLYQNDQLEEGEVDVRLNSFKGCFVQRHNKSKL